MKEKIFLALSDKNLNDILTKYLTEVGYVVQSTQDGKDVIEKMKVFTPDLLLIDIVLPNKSGYDVLTEKSFDRDVTKIPTIIISNSGQAIHIKKIPSTPTIKDYIIKMHIEPAEVLARIEKALDKGLIDESKQIEKTEVVNGKKILWVEDDKLLSAILSKKFKTAGYNLLKAKREDEVFKFLETEVPDIILLDIMLPGMNGMDILQKIKMNPTLVKIPVIVLSNLNKQSDFEKAKTLGANKFLVKATVSLNEIVNDVDFYINTYKQFK